MKEEEKKINSIQYTVHAEPQYIAMFGKRQLFALYRNWRKIIGIHIKKISCYRLCYTEASKRLCYAEACVLSMFFYSR